MPELAGVQHAPIDHPARVPSPRWPVPYPGMPVGLELLSMQEVASWGERFGIDTPYFWAPSGWGEIVPIYGGEEGEVTPGSLLVKDAQGSRAPNLG